MSEMVLDRNGLNGDGATPKTIKIISRENAECWNIDRVLISVVVIYPVLIGSLSDEGRFLGCTGCMRCSALWGSVYTWVLSW